jgi:hypothetical protein
LHQKKIDDATSEADAEALTCKINGLIAVMAEFFIPSNLPASCKTAESLNVYFAGVAADVDHSAKSEI